MKLKVFRLMPFVFILEMETDLMKHLKCIVFDMDGTLTQTNQLIYDSFNYIAKKYAGRTYTIP